MTFEECFSFTNLLKMHKRCRRCKTHKKEVVVFELSLSENLTKLSNSILNNTYKISAYRKFMVYDPKQRVIEALPYKDRLVQMALCNGIIEPKLEKKLIYDNTACRKNKGTNFAINRLKTFLHNYFINNKTNLGYCLKIDIKKYFASINNNILLNKLYKSGFDSKSINLMQKFIGQNLQGLSLGNQTSQWFALLYLDEIDRLIKEKLKVKYYLRYMDDLILINNNKTFLKNCLNTIVEVCKNNLQLNLNKKTQIVKLENGIDFLGFRHMLNNSGKVIVKLRQTAKKRINKKFRLLKTLFNNNIVNIDYLDIRINSYLGHIKNTQSHAFLKKQISRLK